MTALRRPGLRSSRPTHRRHTARRRSVAAAADELSDHLVVTYDRRGTPRSARPPQKWQTSVAEQDDDAASVLSRVGVSSALVFGTNAEMVFSVELPAFQSYRPDADQLAGCRVPVTVPVGEDEKADGSGDRSGGREYPCR